MRVGYALFSFDDPQGHSQTRALAAARCDRIFLEKVRKKGQKRLELGRCLRFLGKGDTLIVWRLDNLASSTADFVSLAIQLEDRGIRFISLSELIDTEQAVGRLAIHFFGIMADFERNLVRQRTMEGLARARSEGRVGGRVRITSGEEDRELVRVCKEGHFSQVEIAEMAGISLVTLARRLRAHREREQARQKARSSSRNE